MMLDLKSQREIAIEKYTFLDANSGLDHKTVS
jgi:hypothetical protein